MILAHRRSCSRYRLRAAGQRASLPVAFDQNQTRSLTGTAREFQWTNPHCYIQLLVKNAKGVEEEWSLEMGAPMHPVCKWLAAANR